MEYTKRIQKLSKINGHSGWYDLVYNNLLEDVNGLISSGMSKQRALEVAFGESCASKGIKHRIENIILRGDENSEPEV